MNGSLERAPSTIPSALIEALLGCLLHDVGKPVQRAHLGYAGKHSAVGRAFMKKVWLRDNRNPSELSGETNETDLDASDLEILDAISYHHGAALRSAAEHGRLGPNAPAYIAYIADNIAAGADRRRADTDGETGSRDTSTWDPDTPLYSVFNRFGPGQGYLRFRPKLLDDRVPINVPRAADFEFDKDRYTEIAVKLDETLRGLERTPQFATSLLNTLEATLSYVPSSTNASEVVDISLFDHLRLTGALGSCIWHYLDDKRITDFKTVLLDNEDAFYDHEAFLLVALDVTGIQDFIFTIHSAGAAKMLRARSFYLELLTEHLVDELLEMTGLSRANLNYSGGGHAYLLLPNTASTRTRVEDFERQVNDWLLEKFRTGLFVSVGSVPFCARMVMRRDRESSADAEARARAYSGLFRAMSEQITAKKLARYSADQLRGLNAAGTQGERECRVCHAVDDTINVDGLCATCAALAGASRQIQKKAFVVVEPAGSANSAELPLPFDKVLTFHDQPSAAGLVESGTDVRVYAKNKFYTGPEQGVHLWIGDYCDSVEFSDYADQAGGIRRLGVLRLDVDDLGAAFTEGFNAQGSGAFNTISRTGTFSRMVSLFFRQHINYLCEDPKYRPLTGEQPKRKRRCTIIYSGGDDLFVVGSWDDVLELSIELRDEFRTYTQGKLTVSAGVGMYPDKYPISVMARETGRLEEAAKSYPHNGDRVKDAVAVFSPEMTFGWDRFKTNVIDEKYRHIEQFFHGDDDAGKAFIYRLLALLSERDDQISLARWVYMLSRMESTHHGDAGEFRDFTNQLHRWFQDAEAARELTMALQLYVYRTRNAETVPDLGSAGDD